MKRNVCFSHARFVVALCAATTAFGQGNGVSEGQRLFESETFGGNGRTCRTCHSRITGTISPEDVQQRFKTNLSDPLFLADGSDDGLGNGTTRIRTHATIIMRILLRENVRVLSNNPGVMIVNRGIPTTLNTPGLDPVLMYDGRQPTLQAQAAGAIQDHAQAAAPPQALLDRIRAYELTEQFFSSAETRSLAAGRIENIPLPQGNTASEKRGRRFFEDVLDFEDAKHGFCAACHSGPMLNQTNLFLESIGGPPRGSRFQNILVSEFNAIGNPVQEFVFNNERHVWSPDIGRSAITGVSDLEDPDFSHFNAFKIPQLRGVRDTGPYFHDNSAKTLEDVLAHYAIFFNIVVGGEDVLTSQDQTDIIAFLKLLR